MCQQSRSEKILINSTFPIDSVIGGGFINMEVIAEFTVSVSPHDDLTIDAGVLENVWWYG